MNIEKKDYYLIIDELFYEHCKQQGVISYNWDDPFYVEDPDDMHEEIFKRPYEWMLNEYQKRIQRETHSLVWVWCQRPDLRHSAHMPRGTRSYLLHLKLDPTYVLVSDFFAWHLPLNEMNRPLDLKEYASEEERQRSWERIFDPSIALDPDFYSPDEHPVQQGVIDAIPLSAIVKERFFIAR